MKNLKIEDFCGNFHKQWYAYKYNQNVIAKGSGDSFL